MSIADSGELTDANLPAFKDRLETLLKRAPFAYIADTAQLFDECILTRVRILPAGRGEQKLCVDIGNYGGIFTLSVAPPQSRHRLYQHIRYTFNNRSLFILAVGEGEPRDLYRFYFIGR